MIAVAIVVVPVIVVIVLAVVAILGGCQRRSRDKRPGNQTECEILKAVHGHLLKRPPFCATLIPVRLDRHA